MGIIHSTIPFQNGGLHGIQSSQNDWSSYLVHFTTAHAMISVKEYPCKKQYTPQELAQQIEMADKESFDVIKKIQSTMELRASSPSEKDMIQTCICFSECNLSGLLSHSERYGRFGFVFSKKAIFDLGGRPTMYVDNEIYTYIAKKFRDSEDPVEKKIFSLANLYSPPGAGKVQDFTHEREWRLFSNLSLNICKPVVVFCPQKYYDWVSPLFGSITIPLDLLGEWGL
jgi:hypothetical protein